MTYIGPCCLINDSSLLEYFLGLLGQNKASPIVPHLQNLPTKPLSIIMYRKSLDTNVQYTLIKRNSKVLRSFVSLLQVLPKTGRLACILPSCTTTGFSHTIDSPCTNCHLARSYCTWNVSPSWYSEPADLLRPDLWGSSLDLDRLLLAQTLGAWLRRHCLCERSPWLLPIMKKWGQALLFSWRDQMVSCCWFWDERWWTGALKAFCNTCSLSERWHDPSIKLYQTTDWKYPD